MKLPKFLRRQSPPGKIPAHLVDRMMIPVFVPRKDLERVQAVLADAGIRTSPFLGLARVDQLQQTYGPGDRLQLSARSRTVFTGGDSRSAAWLVEKAGRQIVINDPLGDVADYIATDPQRGRLQD